MSVIVVLLCAGILLAGGFLIGFIWAVRTGQFDDTQTPALRILGDSAGTIDPAEERTTSHLERGKHRASG